MIETRPLLLSALAGALVTAWFAGTAVAAPEDGRPEATPPGPPIALAPPGDPAFKTAPKATPAALTPPAAVAPADDAGESGQPLLLSPFANRIVEALETSAPLAAWNAGQPFAAAVRAFYEARAFNPIWTDGETPLPRAHSLLEAVLAVADDGLEPADYVTPAVRALFDARDSASQARLEAALTWALVRLTSDLASGRTTPNEVDPEHYVHPHDIEPAAVLAQAAARDDIAALVQSHAPQTAEYRNLKAALERYRAIQRLGGWTLMRQGRILRPGDRDPRIAELKEVLAERGEAVTPDGDYYDKALKAAVRAFQLRHGLTPDGRFGPQTNRALNRTVAERIDQLKINMERRRWMPDDLGERYAYVNLANFKLQVVFEGEQVYETRVVVGTAADRTPVFSDRMTYLVINPYWNIPPSIAGEEMLPQLRADPYSLAAKGIRVFSGWSAGAQELDPGEVDWSKVSAKRFPFKLRQDGGEQNALGRVKFMFPNKFNIYLHDTPSKSLFNRTVRTFSHGCIRVEEPFKLAKLLLSDDPRWTSERFDAQVESYERRTVTLPKALNVHLTYLTAWVDEEGVVQFRNDIYGRDQRLSQALNASRTSTPMASRPAPTPTAISNGAPQPQ